MKRMTKTLKVHHYFTIAVHIFKTRRKMLNFANRNEYSCGKDTMAMYQPCDWWVNKNNILIKVPLLGELLFNSQDVNSNIIVHEGSHAGMDCIRQINKYKVLDIEEINDREEALCYYIGDISEMVFTLFKELGVVISR